MHGSAGERLVGDMADRAVDAWGKEGGAKDGGDEGPLVSPLPTPLPTPLPHLQSLREKGGNAGVGVDEIARKRVGWPMGSCQWAVANSGNQYIQTPNTRCTYGGEAGGRRSAFIH